MLRMPLWAILVALLLGSSLGLVTGAAIVTTTSFIMEHQQ